MTTMQDVCAGLRALTDYLEAHPDLPVPTRVAATPYLCGTDEEDRAEVDRVAGILGVVPGPPYEGSSHYEVSRHFGGRVCYQATAIPEGRMVAYLAERSYAGVVRP